MKGPNPGPDPGVFGPCRLKPFEIRRAVGGKPLWSGNATGQPAQQPLPENRIGGDPTGFAEKITKHEAGDWRLAPGGVAVYSRA